MFVNVVGERHVLLEASMSTKQDVRAIPDFLKKVVAGPGSFFSTFGIVLDRFQIFQSSVRVGEQLLRKGRRPGRR